MEVITLVVLIIAIFQGSKKIPAVVITTQVPFATPTPGIIPFTSYKKTVLAKSDIYDIYLIGDSMTRAFGPRGGAFNEILSKAYPNLFFEISNYAAANQSILLLPERLHEAVQADKDLLLKPILEGDPDLIIIESFGYNPLSQFGKEMGLKKQEEILTEIMTTLTNRFPNAVIMFLATIAPDKKTYGQNVTNSSADGRWSQAEERIEYITNHIDYANEHGIPVINAYKESLDVSGDGNTKYINPDDNIHPSAEGLALMGRIMTARIEEENIFPKSE
ncbi:MAG: SGNH/GDSL hydrolase family protein [Candidatus Levybacteria bacterium]|nr:SGNH/GDSL hydrolase family protein [Candidatus Levybacteria bacterium]